MKALTRQELESLLSNTICSQERLMYSVIVNHGLRISEALRMDKTNIKAGTLTLKRLKGSLRTEQPLLPNEKKQLEYLAATTEGPFFKTCDRTVEEHCEDLCGCRRKADRHFKQVCEAAGISPLKASCHKLKHTTAMLGLKGGMAINELQTYLGHVNGQNTLEYLKVNDEEASKAFAAAIGGSI